MQKTVLELDFLDEINKKFKLSVADPKEDLEETEIESVMDTILEKSIFSSNNTSLTRAVAARIITTTIDTIEF